MVPTPKDPEQILESAVTSSIEWDFFFFLLNLRWKLPLALYVSGEAKESCVRMKQFTMQIEACEGTDAAAPRNHFAP